ncbi:MAG: hypothetical protein DMF62_06065 [Acidobacteria bacterium]|nr:MAG: hypothetical protein DMF62_06065 [Acidobacteriota bacterium]
MLPQPFREFHNAVLVVTAPGLDERQKSARRQLGDGNFEFVFGINKNATSKDDLAARGIYDEQRAIEIDRRHKSMTLGHICCSFGHREAYRRIIENRFERTLIFEDDVTIFDVEETAIREILAAAPKDGDLIYWGWSGVERKPWFGSMKQYLYNIQHAIGLLKLDHTMIGNLYPREFNQHFLIAGRLFGAYAYSVSLEGAQILLDWNTPIVQNADNALMYARLKGDLHAYMSRRKLFGEHSQGVAGSIESLVQS